MPGRVVGVASEKDALLVESTAPLIDLLALFDQHGVSGKQIRHVGGTTTMVVSRDNFHEEAKVRARLREQFDTHVRITDGLGAVSVIGAGINASFDNLRRGTAVLADGGLHPHDIATSSFRITWTLDRSQLDGAVRLLHRTFIDTTGEKMP